MDIYQALADRRDAIDITKIDLAEILKIPPHDITKAERGEAKAHTLEKVCEWAEALGLEITVRCKDDS